MKKIVIILAFIATGCSDNCTEIYDVYKKIESRKTNNSDDALIINQKPAARASMRVRHANARSALLFVLQINFSKKLCPRNLKFSNHE